MANAAAWFLFFLGFAHIAFGLVRFKKPLLEAIADGFVGQFAATEGRRAAFWFLIAGPLLILVGHVGIHAAAHGDLVLLRILGVYCCVTALLGVVAFPRSPFWALLLVSPFLIAAGYGLL